MDRVSLLNQKKSKTKINAVYLTKLSASSTSNLEPK